MMNVSVPWTITRRIFHQMLWGDPKKTGKMGIPFARMALTLIRSEKNLVVTRPMTSLF